MSAVLGHAHAPVERPTDPAELTRYLYEQYGQRVFTFCYSRLRNREEAQDAAQTTFIYVMRSLQRGVEPEFELAWLLKIAFNVCRGARRSTGRLTAVTQEVEDIDELAAPAAAGYEGSERLEALRDALAHLPERQRQGILLREWQGLSYAEIADELNLSLGAVETLLFRARRNLAARLEHVRSGVGALNVVSLAPFARSLFRGTLGKLGLIGASASVALIPVVVAEVTPALANGHRPVTLRATAPARTATTRPAAAAAHASRSVAVPKTSRALFESISPARPEPLLLTPSPPHGAAPTLAPTTAAGSGSDPSVGKQLAPLAPIAAPAPAPATPTPVAMPALPAPAASRPLEFLAGTLDRVQADLPRVP